MFRKYLTVFAFLLISGSAYALDTLPYGVRTHNYSGFGTGAWGDIRTVGMAGATTGLADTFLASLENPAGLAMTLGIGDDNFSSNDIRDGHVQNYDNQRTTHSYGVGLGLYPFGFTMGYVAPYREAQDYSLSSAPGVPATLNVAEREFRMAGGVVLLNDRLAAGLSLNFGEAERSIAYNQGGGQNFSDTAHSFGVTVGLLGQLPDRILVGFGYTTPMHYVGASDSVYPVNLPGFVREVDVPGHFGLGVGWIPNRFFRTDASLNVIGTTPNTALLKDDTTMVGQSTTLQPKLGAAYVFAEFQEFKGTVFGGSYYEVSRIDGAANRIHFTTGTEIKPWIISFGTGIDVADNYKNYLISIGVDVFKLMAKLGLIPRQWQPTYGGFLPSANHLSDEGLARPLVRDWKPRGPDMNPLKVTGDLPGKIRDLPSSLPDRMDDTGDDLKQLGSDIKEVGEGIAHVVGGGGQKKKKPPEKQKSEE